MLVCSQEDEKKSLSSADIMRVLFSSKLCLMPDCFGFLVFRDLKLRRGKTAGPLSGSRTAVTVEGREWGTVHLGSLSVPRGWEYITLLHKPRWQAEVPWGCGGWRTCGGGGVDGEPVWTQGHQPSSDAFPLGTESASSLSYCSSGVSKERAWVAPGVG